MQLYAGLYSHQKEWYKREGIRHEVTLKGFIKIGWNSATKKNNKLQTMCIITWLYSETCL